MHRHLRRGERRLLIAVVTLIAVVAVVGAAIALTGGDDDETSQRASRVVLDTSTISPGRPLAARVKLRGATDGGSQTTVSWYLSFDAKRDDGDLALVGGGAGDAAASRPAVPRDAPAGSYRVLACTSTGCAASDGRVVVRARGAAQQAGSETLLAAGDIATCDETADTLTAELVQGLRGTVAALGDNAYERGTAEEYANCYEPTWGRFKDRTRPAPGNHEYAGGRASGYFGYFGERAGPPARGWYSYNLGAWHLIALNSNCQAIGGCERDSPQGRFLARDLASNRSRCTLAYWHHPRFSSGLHGDQRAMTPFWELLQEHGADVVLGGHDHHYERFAPQTPDGKPAEDGVREFVAGTGGRRLYPLAPARPNSQVRSSGTHGVLELTLRPRGYAWRFLPVDGTGFTDDGEASCH